MEVRSPGGAMLELVSALLHRAVVSTRGTLAAQVITVTDKHRASNNTRVVPLCHEDGGRMGNESHDFTVRLAVAAGPHEADRRAFITYWTQRLCITNQKGIAKVLDKMRPITAAPHVLEQVTRNIGVPNARPLGKLASHASARRPGEGNNTTWGGLVIAAFQERTQRPAAPLVTA